MTFPSPTASNRQQWSEHLADFCSGRKAANDDSHNLAEAVLATAN